MPPNKPTPDERSPMTAAAAHRPASAAHDPAAAHGMATGADRDGHGLRLPLRPDRRRSRSRHRAGRGHRRDGRPRLRRDHAGRHGGDADDGGCGSPRPRASAADRGHAIRLLRGFERAGDRERPAIRQGGRLRRGEAGTRRPLRRPGPRDHSRWDPGDGARRTHPADGNRARRLQGPGAHRGDRGEADGGSACPAGRRLLRDRLRGDPGGGHGGARPELEIPVIGIGAGPATDGRCSSCTTCSASMATSRSS
jgi:hypothetical protein